MLLYLKFFFKHMTAYECRISDWISDVFSSNLMLRKDVRRAGAVGQVRPARSISGAEVSRPLQANGVIALQAERAAGTNAIAAVDTERLMLHSSPTRRAAPPAGTCPAGGRGRQPAGRSVGK